MTQTKSVSERLCEKYQNLKTTRRQALKAGALLGGSAVLSTQIQSVFQLLAKAEGGYLTPSEEYTLSKAENVIYSVCLQCHTSCPIKAKLLDGVLVKISGPGYSSQAMLPHMNYETSPQDAVLVDGKLCPKGQAGIQSLYDPYRIRKVLKRSGKRGENQWETIPFEQAIDEIVNGGALFAHVPGEDNRIVPGLKDLFMVKDPVLSKQLAQDAKAVAGDQLSLDEFKNKHRDHLSALIDPDHPDLGPLNNQFVFLAGRIEHGRKEFSKRWLNDGFGSANWYEHTTICEQSHHIAYEQMTNQYKDGNWSGGKHHMKPDALNAEFIIFFGTGAFEANFGPPPMSEKITSGIVSGRLKIAVVDPRFSKTAAKAWKWVPVKPGGDAALALGMIRWIIDHKRYDANYLKNANRSAAEQAGEPTWSNATWLVKLDEGGQPQRLLRAQDVGLGDDEFVVSSNGVLTTCMPESSVPTSGELFVEGQANGVSYKSSLQLLWEEAAQKTTTEWARLAGLDEGDIESLAKEFTSHGKKAAAELYRGAVQHTNGYYNAQAIISLNLLVGNPDWKGGLGVGGGHWHEDGSKSGQPFPLKTLPPNKLTSFGIKLTREGSHYEQSTLFKRDHYPAKRPWYPLTSNVYQEVLPSAAQGYPYPVKAVFLHKGTPGYAIPAANDQLAAMADVTKLPLFIACDIVIAESSMYADYLFPDLSIWERWGTPHTTPDVQTKTSKVRQPIVAPIPETVTVYGEQMPISMEAIMLAIAERLKLSGFGPNGFGSGKPLAKPEDFFLRMVANLALEGDGVPEADSGELELFLKTRQHLPPTVFDPQRWEKTVGKSNWRKVVYVLNRGGRYENFAQAYKEQRLAHQFAKQFNFFVEKTALTKHSMTGKPFSGLPKFEPIKDAFDQEIDDDGYDLKLITYKKITGGQSRTLPNNYWLAGVTPENYVLLNALDAQRFNLNEGEVVKLVSASNPDGMWNLRNGKYKPIAGKIKIIQGLRPGVVAVSWHFGHWAYGAGDVQIDGQSIKGDTRRGTGLCPNAAMRVDPALKDVCLTDPIGGSSSFYDTKVRLERVREGGY